MALLKEYAKRADIKKIELEAASSSRALIDDEIWKE
jgi:hypothetical protein